MRSYPVSAFISEDGVFDSIDKAHRAEIGRYFETVMPLKDPDSARIRLTNPNPGVYCGQYNAKNSYGGYVGYKPFMLNFTVNPPEFFPDGGRGWTSSQPDTSPSNAAYFARRNRLIGMCKDWHW